MNSLTTTIAYLIFMAIEQHSGSFFSEKRGSCPMYKVMARSAFCAQEKDECETDYFCKNDLKCCESERCGVSKCTRPILDQIETPVRSFEICPDEKRRISGCKPIETKFCYKIKCERCCTHKNTCNPLPGLLLLPDECRKAAVDPRPSIAFDRTEISSGESVEIKCQPRKNDSLVQWTKMMEGSMLTIPKSMIEESGRTLILKIKSAVVGDSGNYTCKVIDDGKTYYREVTISVKRSENRSVCLQSFQEGLCDGKLTKYYYDVKDDTCKSCQYHGCKGNDNNFASKIDCEKRCKGTRLKCPISGLPKYDNCPSNQLHECEKDEDCGYRRTCCLVGCSKRCIDPSKPWIPSTPKTIAAIATTKPATTRGTAVKVPCGKRYCHHYAECRKNPIGSMECACPTKCNLEALSPICALATERTKISTDLCQFKECSPYGKCVINRFNGQPQCLCPRFCKYVRKVVCGSDGKTYFNECFLKITSCRKQLLVTKAHNGSCNKV